MSNFMNAELVAIRESLTCGHCCAVFRGSDSQARKVKYEKRTVYCSDTCRSAAISAKLSRPLPNQGPCGTCGEVFFSRTAKQFCNIGCYTKSKLFTDMLAESRAKASTPESIEKRAAAARKGDHVQCIECGEEFYQKREGATRPAKKYCSRNCYRSYMSKRFDRWIANPQGIALPQCYDEFLDSEELECIVDGCNWRGRHLSLHINNTHGIQATEFKRAAGFNLNSGLVSKDLAQVLRERKKTGVALREMTQEERCAALAASIASVRDKTRLNYKSKEGAEHREKARALKLLEPCPIRCCAGCGAHFQQSTPMGKAIYCSVPCRTEAYRAEKKARAKNRVRQPDGTFKWEPSNTTNEGREASRSITELG